MSALHNPIACARLNVIVLFDYLWMRSWPLMRRTDPRIGPNTDSFRAVDKVRDFFGLGTAQS